MALAFAQYFPEPPPSPIAFPNPDIGESGISRFRPGAIAARLGPMRN
jgi:hypothetical protein